MRAKILVLVIFCAVLTVFSHNYAFAQPLQLEVNLLEGGFDAIDFGSIRILDYDGNLKPATLTRRVQVKITNTGTARYQVIQRVDTPFLNQQGSFLKDGTLKFYISGATQGGIMDPASLTPVVVGDRIIYSSDNNGSSDVFNIDYYLQADNILPAGRYRMNVSYILTSR